MSLTSFQRALCDLIASPQLCLAVRTDAKTALAGYDLSAREHMRLSAIVWQRGMSTNCTLYRSNRITPIYTLLPFTCRSLGAEFGALVDQFWQAGNYKDGQFKSEVDRFAAFLRERIAAGSVASPFAGELLAFELARIALEFGPRKNVLRALADLPPLEADKPCRLHPLARLVRLRHDPEALFDPLVRGAAPPPDLPETEALIVLSVAGGDLSVLRLKDSAGCLSDGTGSAPATWASPRFAPELADAGLLLPVDVADQRNAALGSSPPREPDAGALLMAATSAAAPSA